MSKAKLLSCKRCRLKKVKCNYEYPCSNCVKGKHECVKVVDDMRKKRHSAKYIESLEKQHTKLIGMLKKLEKCKNDQEKFDSFKNINLNELLNNHIVNQISTHGSSGEFHEEEEDDDDNDLGVYGPTSIYDNELITKNSNSSSDIKEINRYNKNPEILHCIKLFFVWQYPDLNMFIFREAFLKEFFKPKFYNIYCSKVLILSICALGSRMSKDEKIYAKSIKFYNEAKSLLLSKLSNPSITSLQSYLLLAFYDIFNGYNSSGWMLSGNAMRMGFDLGFQLHPNSWFLKQKVSSYTKEIDNEIKSRIYWGTYLADHFISLILGRPSLLKLSDTTIPETDDLPELDDIDDYRYLDDEEKLQNKKVSNISDPLKKIINLINISDNILNDIFNKNFNQDLDSLKNFNSKSSVIIQILDKLNEYNEKIFDWKLNLPTDLQFNKTSLLKSGDNPTLSLIRYYYYILLLCLNRPFVGLEDEVFLSSQYNLIPKKICLDAIEDLYISINQFKKVHGLTKSSVLIVYCSILAVSILLLINSKDSIKTRNIKLKFFLVVLRDTSRTWNLAKKSFISITSRLSSYEDIDFNLNDLNFHEEIQIENYKSPTPEVKLEYESLNSMSAENNHETKFENHDFQDAAIGFPVSTTSSVTDNLEFFGGPPMLMTSDLFDQNWESLFPDYVFNDKS